MHGEVSERRGPFRDLDLRSNDSLLNNIVVDWIRESPLHILLADVCQPQNSCRLAFRWLLASEYISVLCSSTCNLVTTRHPTAQDLLCILADRRRPIFSDFDAAPTLLNLLDTIAGFRSRKCRYCRIGLNALNRAVSSGVSVDPGSVATKTLID